MHQVLRRGNVRQSKVQGMASLLRFSTEGRSGANAEPEDGQSRAPLYTVANKEANVVQ